LQGSSCDFLFKMKIGNHVTLCKIKFVSGAVSNVGIKHHSFG
jgi:hypothetical protein